VLLGSLSAMSLVVCQGGACQRNGAKRLLEVLQALGQDDLPAQSMTCCSLCPAVDVIVKVEGASPALLKSRSSEEALDSARGLLEGLGILPSPDRTTAVTAKLAGDDAVLQGDYTAAIPWYDLALASEAAATIMTTYAQPPTPPAPLEWESSSWCESAWQSDLCFEESATAFEFGSCADGSVKLVEVTIEETTMTGELETPDGYCTFEVTMSEDGRSFEGVIIDEQEMEQPWSGARSPRDGGGVAEEPSAANRWLVDALTSRSRAHVALGNGQAALDDAESAVMLCCLVPDCWDALEHAAEAAGASERAAVAHAEVRWLTGDGHDE